MIIKIDHPYKTELPLILRGIRDFERISQEKVAEALGISLMGISHKELGRRSIKLNELNKWAEVLGYDIIIKLKKKA